jgi:hypothetical protein
MVYLQSRGAKTSHERTSAPFEHAFRAGTLDAGA